MVTILKIVSWLCLGDLFSD